MVEYILGQIGEETNVPEISKFLGIVIAMYFKDHGPPHFHAKYGGKEQLFPLMT